MKERLVYQCEYCRRIRFTKEAMERHEAECLHNPLSVNCYRCARAYEGIWVDDCYGVITEQKAPCCRHAGEIRERMADKCSAFVRSDKPWYTRCEVDALEEFVEQ